MLDIGCGTGFIARRFAPLVDRLDAVDISAAMIEEARRLPGGDHPSLTWFVGAIETTPLHPPYALITAAQSMHWLDWDVTLPRLHNVLSPEGALVILDEGQHIVPWQDGLLPIIRRYSTNQQFVQLDPIAELERRGLFALRERRSTEPEVFRQPIDDYVESFHARASFVRERMGAERAAALDADVRSLVEPYARDGMIEMSMIVSPAIGRPLAPGRNTESGAAS